VVSILIILILITIYKIIIAAQANQKLQVACFATWKVFVDPIVFLLLRFWRGDRGINVDKK